MIEQNEALNSFLSYHYGNYRFTQEQGDLPVMAFDEWIVKIGVVKLWKVYEKLRAERDDKVSE